MPSRGGVDIFLRDVTARRRLDEQRPATRRRDEVLGIVAHDLRNHLNTIRASSKVALVTGDRSLRRPIETIERASRRMERLIRDLLDVSAIECGTLAIDPSAVRPIELLSESVDAHAAASAELGIGLSLDCDEPLPEIAADLQRLLQILGNLLGNAIKFTPRGGRIVVGAAQEVDGRHVRFWVSDSGQGIPLDQVPHVFDKFSPNRGSPGREWAWGSPSARRSSTRTAVGSGWRAERGGTTVSFTMPCDDLPDARCQARGDRVHVS